MTQIDSCTRSTCVSEMQHSPGTHISVQAFHLCVCVCVCAEAGSRSRTTSYGP